MQYRIILASASKQRAMFLNAIDIDFEIIPANINEQSIRDSDLKIRVEKIARAKAEAVQAREKGIIISADTFLRVNGQVLEKPENLADAKRMLNELSGSSLLSYTGFCYLDAIRRINYSTCVVNEVKLRNITEHELSAYVEKFPVTTWSGGLSPAYIYGLTFVSKITGSPSAFTHGIPMDLVITMLEQSGIRVKPKDSNLC